PAPAAARTRAPGGGSRGPLVLRSPDDAWRARRKVGRLRSALPNSMRSWRTSLKAPLNLMKKRPKRREKRREKRRKKKPKSPAGRPRGRSVTKKPSQFLFVFCSFSQNGTV